MSGFQSVWQTVLGASLAGNEVWRWLLFCLVLLVALIGGRLSRILLLRIAKRMRGEKREAGAVVLNALARPTLLLWLAVALFLTVRCRLLVFPDFLISGLTVGTRALLAAALGYAIYCLVDVVDHLLSHVAGKTESKVDDMLVPLVGKSIRVTILVLVVVQVAQEISAKPITSIIAGLGVGGLAIALAGQDTIKNFFGSLVIVGDKPFEIGDRIMVDGHDGPVEAVGFRSTKLRTLDGHLVTVPNSEMVNKTIQNIGKRPYIKHVANIGITYDTPPVKVDEALSIIKELLHDHEGMDPEFPPRVFFNAFNDCSLNILVIFWYHPPDYWEYMAFTQAFNRELLVRFNEAGIEFAFPSQTVYLAGQSSQESPALSGAVSERT
jgi:MscS family membrane protein